MIQTIETPFLEQGHSTTLNAALTVVPSLATNHFVAVRVTSKSTNGPESPKIHQIPISFEMQSGWNIYPDRLRAIATVNNPIKRTFVLQPTGQESIREVDVRLDTPLRDSGWTLHSIQYLDNRHVRVTIQATPHTPGTVDGWVIVEDKATGAEQGLWLMARTRQ
jgi:hypothetical protein